MPFQKSTGVLRGFRVEISLAQTAKKRVLQRLRALPEAEKRSCGGSQETAGRRVGSAVKQDGSTGRKVNRQPIGTMITEIGIGDHEGVTAVEEIKFRKISNQCFQIRTAAYMDG